MLAIQRQMEGKLVDPHPGQEADIGDTAGEDRARHRRGLRLRGRRRLDHRAAVFQHLVTRAPLGQTEGAVGGDDFAVFEAWRRRDVDHAHRHGLVKTQPGLVDRAIARFLAARDLDGFGVGRRWCVLDQASEQAGLDRRVDGDALFRLGTEQLAFEPVELVPGGFELGA